LPAVNDVLLRGCVNDGGFWYELGEFDASDSAGRGIGDPDNDPALKGWNDTDGRRPVLSSLLRGGREEGTRLAIGRELGGLISKCFGKDAGGELVSELGG
jgi:hypothetical protein